MCPLVLVKRCIFASYSLAGLFSLQALPVGNTAAPALVREGLAISSDYWVDVRAGYEGDFVRDALLKQVAEGSGRVDTFQQYTNSATVTLNILDRLDLFGVLGSSRACSSWRFHTSSDTVNQIQLETDYRCALGLGGRSILFEWGKVDLGVGGRYAYCHYKPSWLTTNAVPTSTRGTHLFWGAWQVDLDLSYQIDLFTPYIGMKCSHTQVKLGTFSVPISNNESGDNHFENKIPVGLLIGCGISNGNYFMLDIEGRLIDENAVTIFGDLRF